jgi:hypothetical protein
MKVETIGYVKKSAVTLALSEPILVTPNGVSAYVIESYEQQKRENAITLLKLLTLSEKDKAEGRVFSKEQLVAFEQTRTVRHCIDYIVTPSGHPAAAV